MTRNNVSKMTYFVSSGT